MLVCKFSLVKCISTITFSFLFKLKHAIANNTFWKEKKNKEKEKEHANNISIYIFLVDIIRFKIYDIHFIIIIPYNQTKSCMIYCGVGKIQNQVLFESKKLYQLS